MAIFKIVPRHHLTPVSFFFERSLAIRTPLPAAASSSMPPGQWTIGDAAARPSNLLHAAGRSLSYTLLDRPQIKFRQHKHMLVVITNRFESTISTIWTRIYWTWKLQQAAQLHNASIVVVIYQIYVDICKRGHKNRAEMVAAITLLPMLKFQNRFCTTYSEIHFISCICIELLLRCKEQSTVTIGQHMRFLALLPKKSGLLLVFMPL